MIEYPPCKKCGKSHGMGVEEMATGIITPMDVCSNCLYGSTKINHPTEKIHLQEEYGCIFPIRFRTKQDEK